MNRDPLLSFVIVTWNSERTIRETIESILDTLQENGVKGYEIFIVDNGSTDATRKHLEAYMGNEHFQLILLEKNEGTTYTRNLALRQSRGSYICIMDSDVAIKKWNVKRSLEFIDGHGCLLAPALRYPDGTIQNSVKKFPTLTAKLLKLLKIFFGIQKYASLDFYDGFPFHTTMAVESAISALWLFPSEFLHEVGYTDEKIFYAPEDVDYCLRIQKAGHDIYYYPELEAIHHTQHISHKSPFSKIALSHFFGLLYYFVKHKYLFSTVKLKRQIEFNRRGKR
jgi:glycosyltransferase involved in cell wall biosynthesis